MSFWSLMWIFARGQWVLGLFILMLPVMYGALVKKARKDGREVKFSIPVFALTLLLPVTMAALVVNMQASGLARTGQIVSMGRSVGLMLAYRNYCGPGATGDTAQRALDESVLRQDDITWANVNKGDVHPVALAKGQPIPCELVPKANTERVLGFSPSYAQSIGNIAFAVCMGSLLLAMCTLIRLFPGDGKQWFWRLRMARRARQ
ncbi:hypothetical protein BOC44_21735 (plasmid) [Burkholderia pseudomallei]|nr:hypothetical protein BOC44_21735 [Burkholderia pseudomallei]